MTLKYSYNIVNLSSLYIISKKIGLNDDNHPQPMSCLSSIPNCHMALHLIKIVFYHFFYQHSRYAFSQERTHVVALWKSIAMVTGKNFVPEVGVQMKKTWPARPWVTLAKAFITTVLGTETKAMPRIHQSCIIVQHWPNAGMTLITKYNHAKVVYT